MTKPSKLKSRKPVPWHRLSRRSDVRIAVMLVVGLFFTANAYLTATGASGLTKLKSNPFDFGPIKLMPAAPAPTYVASQPN